MEPKTVTRRVSTVVERKPSIVKNMSALGPDESFGHSLSMGAVIDCGETEVFALRYSDNGRYLVAALGDGTMQVINPLAGADNALLAHTTHIKGGKGGSKAGDRDSSASPNGGARDWKHWDSKADNHTHDDINGVTSMDRLPCTCLNFRPNPAGSRTQNVFALGRTRGEVELWHAPSHKMLQTKKAFEGGDDTHTLHSLAWARDNSALALGCSDGIIRLLDGEDLKEFGQLLPARGCYTAGANPGHSSRVFSIKFLEESGGGSLAVSGGWDNCVHLWDVRQRRSVQTIFGPHVCGDAIDVNASGDEILTGSWRNDDQLQLWDRRGGRLRRTLRWTKGGSGGNIASCRLYAATFSHASHGDAKFIAAGGGDGINECKVYDHHAADMLVGSILGVHGGVMSLAFAPHGNAIAIGAGGGKVHIVEITADSMGPSPRAGRSDSTPTDPILMA